MYNKEDSIAMSEGIKIYHIALNKVNKKWYNKEKLTRLELLLIVFNLIEDDEYLDCLLEEKGEKIMQEYRKASKIVSSNKENWIAYENERLHEAYAKKKEKRLRNEGKEEGKNIGIEQNKKEIAKKLYQLNVSMDIIKNVTGFTTQQIKNICL